MRNWPRAAYLPIGMGIFLIILTWIYFLGQIARERADVLDHRSWDNTNLVSVFAEHAQRTIEDADGFAVDIRSAYSKGKEAIDFEKLIISSSLKKAIVNMGILDSDGNVVAGPSRGRSRNLADRYYFLQQKSTQQDHLVVGDAVIGVVTNKPTVHISRRIQMPDGTFGGVVVVGLDPGVFTELYKKVEIGKGGYVAFVGYNGFSRARRMGDKTSFGGDGSKNTILQKMIAERDQKPRGTMVVKSQIDGVERIVSYMVLHALSTVVIVSTPVQESFREVNHRARLYIFTASALTLLFVTLSAVLCMAFIRQQRHTQEVEGINSDLERRIGERTFELKAANDRLSTFSYSVCHDLRGPLSTIDGFTGLLERRMSPTADGSSVSLVKRIRGGVSQMTNLIDGLLTLATISHEQLKRENVDLTGISASILDWLAHADIHRKVDIKIQDSMIAHADKRLMESLMGNLIGNAWKFTVNTPAARIEVGMHTDAGGESVYFVKDNGAGFDMAKIDRLFGVFQRLHSESEFKGTGIGLATVKQVISMHGGTIWAEGAVGNGATFYFTLSSEATGLRTERGRRLDAG